MWHESRGFRFGRGMAVVVATAGILATAGCFVSSLSGPTAVLLGSQATYTMQYTCTNNTNDATAIIYADVPPGWTVASTSYSGIVNGSPVSGSGTVSPTDPAPACDVPAPTAGYQRLYFTAGPFPAVSFLDSGSASITFNVAGLPGTYTLAFGGGGRSPSGCSYSLTPETLDVDVAAHAVPATNTLGSAVFAVLLLVLAVVALRRAFAV